jgi:hypothetical protein
VLPTVYEDDLTQDFTVEANPPSRTFRLDHQELAVRGMTDQLEAVEQAVFLILNTERYDWLIHSWNYGVELRGLIGKPLAYCVVEIQRRVTEALLQDDRITAVEDFSFESGKKRVLTTFRVVSIFGAFRTGMEVDI